jgi:hypothetical protein
VIEPIAGGFGQPTNATYQGIYSSLAVPGARVAHLLADPTLLAANPFFAIIARPSAFDSMSVAQLAVAAQPTMLLVWAGIGDASAAVQACDPVQLTPTLEFQGAFEALLDTLAMSNANMVIGNIPPLADLPFTTTLAPVLVSPDSCKAVLAGGNPIPLLGQTDSGDGPLVNGERVSLLARPLLAQGIGIPAAAGGTDTPLPGSVVMTPSELSDIRTRIADYNTIIANAADEHGHSVVDVHALVTGLLADGTEVAGIELAMDFTTGGLISLDGLHPTTVGYGIVANAFIEVINAQFGSNLAEVDLNWLLSISSQAQNTGG